MEEAGEEFFNRSISSPALFYGSPCSMDYLILTYVLPVALFPGQAAETTHNS